MDMIKISKSYCRHKCAYCREMFYARKSTLRKKITNLYCPYCGKAFKAASGMSGTRQGRQKIKKR